MPRRGENIYKRKDGRWEGRYKAGFRDDGRAKYRSVYGKSYQVVREKLAKCRTVPETKSAGTLTVGILLEEWLTAVRLRVKASTFANYRMKADKHLLPEFGGIRYEMLTVQGVHDFIQRKLDAGFSAKYVADIVIVLKSAAKYASRVHGFRNPVADVILPRSEKTELKLHTDVQQKQLFQYLIKRHDATALCILLSMQMGLRVGEVCGLRWSDISSEKDILTVRRTVQRICTHSGTELIVDAPKSRCSRREIPIPAFLLAMLREMRGEDSAYILSGSQKVTEPRTLQRRFESILKKAGVPSMRFHGLRHEFATNCLRAGFDVKTLAEILGHASAETTLRRYVHSSMERKEACMGMLRPV